MQKRNFTVNMSDFKRYADLSHPILRELRAKAPGTFYHSQAVALISYAVIEALSIGDPYLALVGAYFHDIGKLAHADLYIENGMSLSTDEFIANREVILNHPYESEKIADKFNLPDEIKAFMFSHHGTSQAFHFSNIDDGKEFFYTGPTPQTIEEVVVMLVDSVDASVRVKLKNDLISNDFSEIINMLWQNKAKEGQLKDVDISEELESEIKKQVNHFAKFFYHTR